MKNGLKIGAASLCCATAMVFAGCASTSKTASNEPDPAVTLASDPVWRSSLREEAIGVLSDAAIGAHPLLRANAIEGMHKVGGRAETVARAGLHDDNLGVRFVAAMTIGKLKFADSAVFVEPLLNDESPVVRAAAIYALRRNGRNVDPTPLASMLENGDATERAQAAFILGELGDTSAAGLLRSAAHRSRPLASLVEDRLVRLQIAEALVKLGDSNAIETVRAALYPSRPEDLEATALAIQIIGNVNDRRSIDQLVYLTAREGRQKMPAEIRLAAAQALAKLGNRRGSFIADEYWQNSEPAIRAQAAFALGATNDPANLSKLSQLLRDESGIVRVASATAILDAVERFGTTASVDTFR